MKFRTEIGPISSAGCSISHADNILLLGSCFTDNIGALLVRDGFHALHNPMGPLYNPVSLLDAIGLSMGDFSRLEILPGEEGIWHCLNFASRYCNRDREALQARVVSELNDLGKNLSNANVLIITLGTAWVFSFRHDNGTLRPVGNCHKFPASSFVREMLSVDEAYEALATMMSLVPKNVRNVVFTVSPIRHLADGLHGNTLSKSVLQLAVNKLIECDNRCSYFPAYEVMIDDLRDYRFYAADMKHPSEVAADYIYDCFQQTYFDKDTIGKAMQCRRESLRCAHRPIITSQNT